MAISRPAPIFLFAALLLFGAPHLAGADMCSTLLKELKKAEQNIWNKDRYYTSLKNYYRNHFTGPNTALAKDRAEIQKNMRAIATNKRLYPNQPSTWEGYEDRLRFWQENYRKHSAARIKCVNDMKAVQKQRQDARSRWIAIAEEAAKNCKDPNTQAAIRRSYRKYKK